jgi:hypothetical protein
MFVRGGAEGMSIEGGKRVYRSWKGKRSPGGVGEGAAGGSGIWFPSGAGWKGLSVEGQSRERYKVGGDGSRWLGGRLGSISGYRMESGGPGAFSQDGVGSGRAHRLRMGGWLGRGRGWGGGRLLAIGGPLRGGRGDRGATGRELGRRGNRGYQARSREDGGGTQWRGNGRVGEDSG